MKYWVKSKCQKSYYQNVPEKEKPRGKRNVGLKEEFILVLLRLKLGLMERHLADMFAVSVTAVISDLYDMGSLFSTDFKRFTTSLAIKRGN